MQKTAISFIRLADVIRKKNRLVFKHGSSSSGQCAQKRVGIFSYISWSSKSYCFSIEVIASHISLDHHSHSNTATKQDSQRPILYRNCRNTSTWVLTLVYFFSILSSIYFLSQLCVINSFSSSGEKKRKSDWFPFSELYGVCYLEELSLPPFAGV